jgi:anti-sigma-K factor RskA
MNHSQIYELLPAYALGCLDDEDATSVSRHLASCKKCHTRLLDHQRTVDLLAFGAPRANPPAALKKKLMNNIQSTLEADKKVKRLPKRRKWETFWSRLSPSPAWALASLILIISLFAGNMMQWYNTKSLHHEMAQELLIIKIKGTEKAPEADGTLVIGSNRLQGVLVVGDLPVPDDGFQYQLWLLKDGKYTNGGVFAVSAGGYGRLKVISPEPLLGFQAFSVTVEPAGGSLTPTGREILGGAL